MFSDVPESNKQTEGLLLLSPGLLGSCHRVVTLLTVSICLGQFTFGDESMTGTWEGKRAVSQPMGSLCATVGVPWVLVPSSGGLGCAGAPHLCLGSQLREFPRGRGQSSFSGTGWAGEIHAV